METSALHARLLDEARRYDPSEHTRSVLRPYRDVLLVWRAKTMSYEKIATALTRQGLKVSPAAVGAYCRQTFSELEIARERLRIRNGTARQTPGDAAGDPARVQLHRPAPPLTEPGRRGPRIARDNY